MKWFICSLFLGRHYQLWKKIISGIYVINAPLGASIRQGAFNREGRNPKFYAVGASIRYGAFIRSWAFIRSFTVCRVWRVCSAIECDGLNNMSHLSSSDSSQISSPGVSF